MSERDHSLIAEFNARRCEDAFAALVRQHVSLVFATALRQVGDHGTAEEITQNVFVALAESSGKLGSHPTIAGWLYQTTLNKSRERLRSDLRRRRREQVAVNLELAGAEGDSVWASLVPLLDEALLELREADRLTVMLHFMEGRTFCEVGSVLGIGEDAARKRANRCLDQLTAFFRRHGFGVPALTVGTSLFALSSHATPAGLATSATTAGLAAAHSATSTSTLTLIKGALKIMAWTKAKTAVVVGVSVLLAAGTVAAILLAKVSINHSAAMKLLEQVEGRYASFDSFSYSGEGFFQAHSKTNASTFSARLSRPCNYRTERSTTGTENDQFLYWATDDHAFSYSTWFTNTLYKIKSNPDERLAHFGSLDLDTAMATCLPTQLFFNSDLKNPFRIFSRSNNIIKATLQGDQMIGATECRRLVLIIPGHDLRLTLWVGKADSLIYQSEEWIKNGESDLKHKFPAVQIEKYKEISINPQFSKNDFVPDNVPSGLKLSDKFP